MRAWDVFERGSGTLDVERRWAAKPGLPLAPAMGEACGPAARSSASLFSEQAEGSRVDMDST